jgi:hypothetical protein
MKERFEKTQCPLSKKIFRKNIIPFDQKIKKHKVFYKEK